MKPANSLCVWIACCKSVNEANRDGLTPKVHVLEKVNVPLKRNITLTHFYNQCCKTAVSEWFTDWWHRVEGGGTWIFSALPQKQINTQAQLCIMCKCRDVISNAHTGTHTHTYTFSFTHANLTYESFWLYFHTPLSLHPSLSNPLDVTDGCCRQPQS